jgi:hypothetical protein
MTHPFYYNLLKQGDLRPHPLQQGFLWNFMVISYESFGAAKWVDGYINSTTGPETLDV